jgi:cellulose 1,4-beta-cellobiosidase
MQQEPSLMEWKNCSLRLHNGVRSSALLSLSVLAAPVANECNPGAAPVAHVDNPFAAATGYINADYAARVQQAAVAKGGSVGAQMAKVASYPTAVWLDRIAAVSGGSGVSRTLAGHLDAALAQKPAGAPLTITLVIYDLPNRDCAAKASNGELLLSQDGLDKYKSLYIDPIAAILGDPKYRDLRIVTVIEPDSLPNLVTNTHIAKCAEAKATGGYVQGVQYAIDKLHALPNVYLYLDIAHSGWLGWDSNFNPTVQLYTDVVRGTAAGLASIDGFITNTANYTPLEEVHLPDSNATVAGQPIKSATFYEWNPYIDEADFAPALYRAFVGAGFPSSIGMLIDTSRNGWGGAARPAAPSTATDLNAYVNASRVDRRLHRGNWCNQAGGIGARPVANPMSHVDAFVWVKPPGESDGTSNSSQTTPDSEGKSFDPMCDPNAQSTYNSSYRTGALPNAPPAGHWFGAAFELLVQNAYPAL